MRADKPSSDLAVRRFGTGRRVCALHGFTLTGAQFEPLSTHGLEIHAADLPGHGETNLHPIDVPTTVAAIGEWLASFASPVPVVGYSQGGRMALLAAIEYPHLVERLVLVSASAGIKDDGDRALRRARDDRLADHIEIVGVEAFLDAWLTGPIAGTAHVDVDAQRRDRAVRSVNTATGLASALRGLGQGVQPYVGDRVAELPIPLLTVSGTEDETYTRLGEEMADDAAGGTHVAVDGAGHNVILDAPEALVGALADFGIA